MADPTPFDWGSTRRVLMSILTPLAAMAAAKWGFSADKATGLVDQGLGVVDLILAASGPVYAFVSNIRAMLADHHDAKVAIAEAQGPQAPAPAPTAPPVAQ